jgi:hypothetical protein
MSWNPLLASSMPLDGQVVDGPRIVADPYSNGGVSEILTKIARRKKIYAYGI